MRNLIARIIASAIFVTGLGAISYVLISFMVWDIHWISNLSDITYLYIRIIILVFFAVILASIKYEE